MQPTSTKILAILALGIASQVTAAPAASLDSRECVSPALNEASLALIEEFEGFRDKPYGDVGGKPTIGWGHLCSRSDCSDINYPIPLSKANGQKLLQSDTHTARQCITMDTASSVVLNANQYGALVSWAFNMGCGAAGDSTLIRRMNNGESVTKVAEEELPKWRLVNGEVIDGLVRRRKAEVALFKTATSAKALPVGC